ncbi:MAG: LuxR C-terminal-related transcriptional regulator [Bradyrhizobium sp.]|nr:LuxR C-terminal-related transcriptional regulator [Bradyrhizobium sp.]
MNFTGMGQSHVATPLAPELLSDVIGSIYDCALDPSKWEAVLARICEEFGFSSAMMGISRFPADPYVLASTGVDRELLDRLPELSADMGALWGGWEKVQQFPLDEPIVHSQASPVGMLQGNAYADQWVARGVADAVIFMIARDATMIGNVGFNRHEAAGPIGDAEINGLRILAPHFRRAVTISNLFDMQRIETATFSNVLDGFNLGIVLVNTELGIVHTNRVAASLLAAEDPFRAVKGTLTLPIRAAHEALQRAVRHAAEDDTLLGARGIGIPAQRPHGEASIIHVLPLKHGLLRHGLGHSAIAALFVAPAVASHLPTDALALLYDLTPAEVRVFELIVSGETSAEIAKRLGVAHSTVKTHLIRLFQKTGCQRQSELVKLAAGLSLPF